jgi:zinc transporter ZupT
LTLEWSPDLSPTQFFIYCKQVRPIRALFPTLVGGLAVAGMSAGFTISSDAGLAGLLLGGAAGSLLYLAWTAIARILPAGLNREANSKLSEAIARSADGLEFDPTLA